MPVLAKPDREIKLTDLDLGSIEDAVALVEAIDTKEFNPKWWSDIAKKIAKPLCDIVIKATPEEAEARGRLQDTPRPQLEAFKECHQLSILLLIRRRAKSLIFPVVYSSGPIASLFLSQVALQATSLRASAKAAKMASRIVLKWHENRER